MDGNTTQRWLSVSFSPAEERHLDAAALDGRYGSLVATCDPQARFALEPTRVTFQAFCVSTNPQSSALGVGTEPISTSKPAQRESEATEQSLQSHDEAQCDATSAAASAAAHDAAILDWDTPQDAPSSGHSRQPVSAKEPIGNTTRRASRPMRGAMTGSSR